MTDRGTCAGGTGNSRVAAATDRSGYTRHARSPPSAEELIKAGPQVETA